MQNQSTQTIPPLIAAKARSFAATIFSPSVSIFLLPSGLSRHASHLHNHLRDSSTAERFTAHELILPQSSNGVEATGEEQDHRGSDERGRMYGDADELDDGHDAVDGGAHVICAELADEVVELARGRADAEEERHFDEEDYEGAG